MITVNVQLFTWIVQYNETWETTTFSANTTGLAQMMVDHQF